MISGFLLSLSLLVGIGPQNLFVLRQSMARHHVPLVVGTCIAVDAVLLLCAGVAGTALAAIVPHCGRAVAALSCAVLLFYGILALKRSLTAVQAPLHASESIGFRTTLGRTLAVSLCNPFVVVDILLILGGLAASHPPAERAVFLSGALAGSVTWFISLALCGTFFRKTFRSAAGVRVLDLAVGSMMILLAASLLRDHFWQS